MQILILIGAYIQFLLQNWQIENSIKFSIKLRYCFIICLIAGAKAKSVREKDVRGVNWDRDM